MSPRSLQVYAIGQELLDSVRLIKSGLGQLQHLNGANDFYHLPLLTLSSGFERFLKVVLCFTHLEKTGGFPSSDDMPKGRDGHNLQLLLSRVRDECFLTKYIESIPVAASDLAYLESDELLAFLRILDRFGQSARYHYLDVVLGREPGTDPPDREWAALETELLLSHPELLKQFEKMPMSDRVFREITSEVLARLERLARALARLFTIGGIGAEAKRYSGYISEFLHLRDEELGKTEYNPFGPNI